MRKLPIKEHKKISDILSKCVHKSIGNEILDSLIESGKSVSVCHRAISAFRDIEETNIEKGSDEIRILYDRYSSLKSKSSPEAISIRRGKKSVDEYKDKLRSRPRPSVPHSIYQTDYWMNQGKSLEESVEIVGNIQRDNALKRSKMSYVDSTKNTKSNKMYWTSRGYTESEAKELIKPYLVKNDLTSMIERYGEKVGTEKYQLRVDRYKESMKRNMANKKTGGYVSKESLSFFIPLRDYCISLGIRESEIYLGVEGSREFFIRRSGDRNSGRFLDFCIPKLSLAVEYNGTFWHPRAESEWKNPFVSFDDAMKKEEDVRCLCESRDIDLFVVWSDDIMTERLDEMKMIIEERLNA